MPPELGLCIYCGLNPSVEGYRGASIQIVAKVSSQRLLDPVGNLKFVEEELHGFKEVIVPSA